MKLPADETPGNMNGDGYLSDEYDQLEMMPAPIRDGDFSEYMWMENEEEFNSQVLRELEEEELMEQCIVAMLDDEESQQVNNNSRDGAADVNPSVNGLSDSVNNLSISSNGVRNNNNVFSDNSDNSCTNNSRSRPFSVQDRLRRHQVAPPPPVSNHELSESEHKSTLNPDAKEFVPVPRTAESESANENVPS